MQLLISMISGLLSYSTHLTEYYNSTLVTIGGVQYSDSSVGFATAAPIVMYENINLSL